MSLYPNLKATANRLLKQYGRPGKITLNVVTFGAVDFATGEATQTTTTHLFDAVTVNYRSSEIDGERVLTGDMRVIASADPVIALIGDTVTIDGVVWRIVDRDPVNPGGIVLLQKWQVRK